MSEPINAEDLKNWYNAQCLVYSSRTRADNYHIRLSVSHFGDYPVYTITRRHVISLKCKELYGGTDIDVAVRIFNEASEEV